MDEPILASIPMRIGAVSPAVSWFDLQPPKLRLRIARLSGRFPYVDVLQSIQSLCSGAHPFHQHGWVLVTSDVLGWLPPRLATKVPMRFGSSTWARTTDLLINSQTLLPAELLRN